MNLSALILNYILSLITTTQSPTNNANGNTRTSSPLNPNFPSSLSSHTSPTLLPRQPQGFTDPLQITQPITFYETVSELLISSGRTYTSVYVDLVSATAAFPVAVSPSTTTLATASTTTSTESTESSSVELKSEGEATTRSEPGGGGGGGGGVLDSTIVSDITLFTVPPPPTSITPPSSTTTTSTTSSSDTSPVLNLAPCSTFTAGVDDPALEGCISSVVSGLSLSGGGPIIASSTSSTTSSTIAITTTAAAAVITTVAPTRTVTLEYLGAVVAKGEATFVVVGGGSVEGKGGRVRGEGGGRRWMVVVVAVVVGWGG